jgi:hypothetical protein
MVEGFWGGQVSAPGKSPALTVGEDLTLEQIRQVFVAYMAAHPEKEKDNVGSAMLHALGKAGLLANALGRRELGHGQNFFPAVPVPGASTGCHSEVS